MCFFAREPCLKTQALNLSRGDPVGFEPGAGLTVCNWLDTWPSPGFLLPESQPEDHRVSVLWGVPRVPPKRSFSFRLSFKTGPTKNHSGATPRPKKKNDTHLPPPPLPPVSRPDSLALRFGARRPCRAGSSGTRRWLVPWSRSSGLHKGRFRSKRRIAKPGS